MRAHALAVLAVPLLAFACSTGNEKKSDTGEPTGPPPDVDCGTPTFPEGTALRRYPYLQAVTHTSARIAWTSTGEGDGKVRIAPSKDGPWKDYPAESEDFPTSRTLDTEDYVSRVATVDDLKQNGGYCYEVWEGDTPVATGLKLNTAWKGAERPVRVLAFGDSGNASPEQKAVRDEFVKHDFDLFLHLGDMAYGDGTFVEFEERVFDIYKLFLHRVPTFPTIGNHEYKTANAQPYLDVYHLFEQTLRPEEKERYYSFDYGNIHFVSLDSNDLMIIPIALDQTGFSDDDMIDWLEADLAASDADWKIAFFHHPPYTSSERDPNIAVRNAILPTLEAGGVDLVLVGHDHHYERSKVIREGAESADGIQYVVAGNGGAGLRPATGDWFTAFVEDQRHGFLSIEISGCSLTGSAIDFEGNEFDTWSLDACD